MNLALSLSSGVLIEYENGIATLQKEGNLDSTS